MRPLTLSLFAQPADDGARLRRAAATMAAAAPPLTPPPYTSIFDQKSFHSTKVKILPWQLHQEIKLASLIQEKSARV